MAGDKVRIKISREMLRQIEIAVAHTAFESSEAFIAHCLTEGLKPWEDEIRKADEADDCIVMTPRLRQLFINLGYLPCKSTSNT